MKDNKDSYIRFRIDKKTKGELVKILEQNGDTISGFLNRTIVKYIREHKELLDE